MVVVGVGVRWSCRLLWFEVVRLGFSAILPRPMECGTWPTNILARLETPASSSRLADQHVHDEHPAALAAALAALFEPLVAVHRPTLANCMNASILIALDCFSIELYMIRFTFYPPGCCSYWPTPPSVIAAGRLTAVESSRPTPPPTGLASAAAGHAALAPATTARIAPPTMNEGVSPW